MTPNDILQKHLKPWAFDASSNGATVDKRNKAFVRKLFDEAGYPEYRVSTGPNFYFGNRSVVAVP